MNKPTKPNVSIPESFANNGTKTDFSETKIENGFERFTPEILAGDNLNKFIDDTYKGLNYSIKTSDAVNLINDEEILTFQNNSFRTLPLQNPTAYSTGKPSEDKILFNELVERKHSTFDPSKFEVVGSPIISDDGVASGFSSKNLVKVSCSLNNNIEFVVRFKCKFDTKEQRIWTASGSGSTVNFLTLVQSSNNKLELRVPNTNNTYYSSIFVYSLKDNEDIWVKLKIKGNTAQGFISIDGINWELKGTNTVYEDLASLVSGTLFLGTYSTYFFSGSIDLSHFSITVDGKEVFSGNKTGLDVIKPDNYEVVGSPVISEDRVVSGFTLTDYIKKQIEVSSIKKLKIVSTFTTSDSYIFGTIWALGATINLQQYGKTPLCRIALDDYGSESAGSFKYLPNTKYHTQWECDFTTGEYKLYYRTDENMEYNIIEGLNENFILNLEDILNIYFGMYRKTYNFSGQIDLNSFKIYVDGNLVYQPCLKIPYTLSKTGSKIVDEAYRDRVIDLYEQQGQAGYYTIDEEKQNFTLPMGEVYGMIESKVDKDMLNNPYSFGDSKYSPIALNNISWLASNGQWNSKATYPDYYAWILENVNNGIEGFKLSTASDITDYDFVLNKADETFMLPLLDGSEDLPSDRYKDLTPGDSDSTYTAPANGWYVVQVQATTNDNSWTTMENTTSGMLQSLDHSRINAKFSGLMPVRKNDIISIRYGDAEFTLMRFVYAKGNGTLYYYVGETVQNANLIDAGRIGEQLAGKADVTTPSIQAPYLKTTYINGTSGYNIWSNGYCEQWGSMVNVSTTTITLLKTFKDTNYSVLTTGTTLYNRSVNCVEKTVSTFKIANVNRDDSQLTASYYWRAFGYLASGQY